MQSPSTDAIRSALRQIDSTEDLVEKALLLAALVSRLFEAAGWPLIVVGGSAVEFYTEGAYMSGDIDLCRETLAPVPLRKAQELMATLNAKGGPRSWEVAGLFVDLLGLVENEARTPCRTVETPCGNVRIIPPELVIVERSLLAFYPRQDSEARNVARKLLAVCISGHTPVNWTEVERLAKLPAFNIADELQELRKEVERELENDT